jgi:hypothetical protein
MRLDAGCRMPEARKGGLSWPPASGVFSEESFMSLGDALKQ